MEKNTNPASQELLSNKQFSLTPQEAIADAEALLAKTNDGTGPNIASELTEEEQRAIATLHPLPDADALSNAVMLEVADGTKKTHFKGYQFVPNEAEVEVEGEVISMKNLTHVKALKLMKQRPRWFASNVRSAYYERESPYWKGYEPKRG